MYSRFDADKYTDYYLSQRHERCDKSDVMSPNKKAKLDDDDYDDVDVERDYMDQRLLSGKSLIF